VQASASEHGSRSTTRTRPRRGRVGKTVGGGYGGGSLAIYVQPTFDTIAAATAALDPARQH
jgi:hypothetical protein